MTLKQAQHRWAKRLRQYGVGYIASGNVVFYSSYGLEARGPAVCDPMSLKQAKVFLAKMPSPGAAIFQLKLIAVGGGKR